MAATGTKPKPGLDETQSALWVRDMFARVAPRYDLVNRVMSMQLDRFWRWRTARLVSKGILAQHRVLDLCCGTGDLLAALEAAAPARYFGADFCHPMLVRTREKSRAPLLEADGLQLPLAASSLDLVTIAFGFRNFANYLAGMTEMLRVLKPGGRLAILEFTRPPNALVRYLMDYWSRLVMDPVGRWLSGQGDAYKYLPASVARFPDAPSLAAMMTEAGFAEARFQYFDLGVVALHIAVKRL